MANIKYEVTRWDVSVCHHTHPTQAGYAESVILGITATDSESGKSAYKDERISVYPCVELAEFETSSEQWIENQIGSGGWYLELQTRIAAQLVAPEPAPHREMPDFSKMVIGDGYADFPAEEEEEEPEVVEETPADDAPKEDEAPKPKKKAKKKAAPKVEEEEVKEDEETPAG
jgi:hypothetical protein